MYALCVGVRLESMRRRTRGRILRGGAVLGCLGLGESFERNDSSSETPSQCLPNLFVLSKGSPSHKWTPSALPPSAATQLQSWNSRSFLQMKF